MRAICSFSHKVKLPMLEVLYMAGCVDVYLMRFEDASRGIYYIPA